MPQMEGGCDIVNKASVMLQWLYRQLKDVANVLHMRANIMTCWY